MTNFLEMIRSVIGNETPYANEGSREFLFTGSQMPVEDFLMLKPDNQDKLIGECIKNFTLFNYEQQDKFSYPYTNVPSVETLANWLCEATSYPPDPRKKKYETYGYALDNNDMRKSRKGNIVFDFRSEDVGPLFVKAWIDYSHYVGINPNGVFHKYGETLITTCMSDNLLKGLLISKVRPETAIYAAEDTNMKFEKNVDAPRVINYIKKNRRFCEAFERQFNVKGNKF